MFSSLICQSVVSQNSFYKYLYHGYNSGRNYGISEAIVLNGDTLITEEGVSGHGVNSSSLSFFDAHGRNFDHYFPRDTSFIPDSLGPHGSSRPIKTQHGYLASFDYGWYEKTLVSGLANYDHNGELIWFHPLTLQNQPFLAQSNAKYGTLVSLGHDTLHYYNLNGILINKMPYNNIIKISRRKSVEVIEASDEQGYIFISNKNDSCQLIKIDSNGQKSSDSLIIGLNILDFKISNNSLITVESDTSIQVVFRDLDFNELYRYSFTNQYPLTYGQIILKDSLVTLVVYNNVDGIKYGTRNIPEIRVINLKGKYLRRRYLRYNGGYMGIIPWNAIGILVNGIDYTSDNGYFMTLGMEAGTLDRQFGILKSDSNIMANDTIQVPAIRLYLNIWDTVLTTMPMDTLSFKEFSNKNSVIVFPNPSNDWIQIQPDLPIKSSYQIFDLSGLLVQKSQLNETQRIDISNLSTGGYLLQIHASEGVLRKKLIKE